MKLNSTSYLSKIFVSVFLFALGFGYGQKQSTKTLFGKQISTQNRIPKNGYIRCASVEYEKLLQIKNPNRLSDAQFEAWITPLVNKYKLMRTSAQIGGIITIPVVVHVIYNGQAIGIAPNITDEQVESQITVLNQDYRKMAGTNGDNINPVGADTQIQFALAKQDPNGNPTNGIDRVSFCQDSWSDLDINTTVKPATIWDPTQYMNMWSVNFSDNTLLGYAQFPDASGLDGLNSTEGNANSDGVVSNYSVFGSKDFDNGTFLLNPTYNLGRTMSHEVGHWLGLRHIWGDGNGDEATNSPDCTATDYCADTPQVGWEHYTCGIFDTCPTDPGNDMPENYMDYSDDSCMNIFTLNQKDRMTTVMTNSTRRKELKTSTKNSPIPLFANDAEVKLEATCETPTCGLFPNQTVQKILLYNRGTSNLTSATLNYSVNGGSNLVYNWTGSIATNKSTTFNITINSVSDGTISISIDKANGVTDERLSNNLANGNFVIPAFPANFTFTDYVFRLQQDLWGSEITWNLKDGSGTIVHSGGPYTDQSTLPALITQNWTLATNQCYTFTINDAAGDGICCGENGNGYYDIKSTNGSIDVASGSLFSSEEIKVFTNYSLDKNAFKNSKEIYIYPNPAKEILNIRVPSYLGLPNRYVVYNILGQMVSQKEVTFEPDLTLNTSALNSGFYFISLIKDSEQKTLKFIKE
jgi:hypothetical protein